MKPVNKKLDKTEQPGRNDGDRLDFEAVSVRDVSIRDVSVRDINVREAKLRAAKVGDVKVGVVEFGDVEFGDVKVGDAAYDVSLQNRIAKRFGILKKWAAREGLTCFRVYEKDLPQYPITLDWLDGYVVVWITPRAKDENSEQQDVYRRFVIRAVSDGLSVPSSQLVIKERKIQKGRDVQYSKSEGTQSIRTVVSEYGVQFELNLTDYVDVGLFLDHRKTRQYVRSISHGKRVLNLFAYTGSFTCYAALGGAKSTTTVDLNPTYAEWTKRNLVLNGIEDFHRHHVMTADCLAYLEKKAYGKQFDVIICDPPTFSNSKRMARVFSVDTDYVRVLTQCLGILAPGGQVIFSTNSRRFKMELGAFSGVSVEDVTYRYRSEDFRHKPGHQSWVLSYC